MIRLEAGSCETLPWLIDRKPITSLLDCFDRDKLAVKTRRGYIAAISGLMKFYGNSTIDEMYIRWPHDSRPNVDWLSPSEARTLANYHFAEPLTNLLVHCELCLGMRRVEVLRLTVSSFGRDTVRIDGKGRVIDKIRYIPYHRRTQEILGDYMKWRNEQVDVVLCRRPATKIPDNLLIHRRGFNIGTYEQHKAQAMNNRMNSAAQEALGRVKLGHHTLRRTFGRQLWLDGVKIETIADMLGHEDLATCKKYIGVNIGDMASAMNKFSI